MIDKFEEQLHQDLHQFLQSMKEIDARLPECPDVEEKWEQIVKAYIPDGIREFNDFPSASLGWMMYGTKEAFNAYVSCLHQLYLFGAAMQLNRMGYHMAKM